MHTHTHAHTHAHTLCRIHTMFHVSRGMPPDMWDSDGVRGHTLLSLCTDRHTCTGEGRGGEGRGGAEEEGGMGGEGRRGERKRGAGEKKGGAKTQEWGGPEEREGHGGR